MLRRIAVAGAIAAFVSLVSLTGCSLGWNRPTDVGLALDSPPIKITMWNLLTNDVRETAIRESLARFNETHKNIQIVPYFYENEAYKNKLRVAMLSNNMPDVFYFWSGESFMRMVKSEVVADLSGMLGRNSEFRDSIIPEALQSTTYGNGVYGIPHSVQHVLIWYSKPIFEKYSLDPPKTWEQLTDIVDTLSSNNIAPVVAAGKERWPILHWFAYLAHRLGGPEPFRRTVTGLGDFQDSSFVEAAELLRDFAARGAFMPGYLGMDQPQAESAFLDGEAAMMLQGDWAASRILEDERQRGEIGYFRFPTVRGQGHPTEYQGGYAVGWAVSKTADLEAAFNVLSFMMNAEERTRYVEISGTATTNRTARFSPERMAPETYEYIRFIESDASGHFGFYDQDIDYSRAQRLLDASVSLVENHQQSRADIEKMLGGIR